MTSVFYVPNVSWQNRRIWFKKEKKYLLFLWKWKWVKAWLLSNFSSDALENLIRLFQDLIFLLLLIIFIHQLIFLHIFCDDTSYFSRMHCRSFSAETPEQAECSKVWRYQQDLCCSQFCALLDADLRCCSWSHFTQLGGYNPQCPDHYWYHCSFHTPCIMITRDAVDSR